MHFLVLRGKQMEDLWKHTTIKSLKDRKIESEGSELNEKE